VGEGRYTHEHTPDGVGDLDSGADADADIRSWVVGGGTALEGDSEEGGEREEWM